MEASLLRISNNTWDRTRVYFRLVSSPRPVSAIRAYLRGLPAELRRIYPRLDLKFLQRIDGRHHDEGVEIRIGVLDAVDCIVIEIGALPGHGYGLTRTNSALPGPCLALRREPRGYIRRKRHQLQVVPSVQRQLDNALVLNDGADGCVVADQQGRVGSHLDRFTDLADLQLEIDTSRQLHL